MTNTSPTQDMKCCEEWTGKEAYYCDSDYARTKPGTCPCECHQQKLDSHSTHSGEFEESSRAFFGQWLKGEDLEAALGWCEALMKHTRSKAFQEGKDAAVEYFKAKYTNLQNGEVIDLPRMYEAARSLPQSAIDEIEQNMEEPTT